MSEPYRGRRCGRSTAFPKMWARQSHPRVDELDSATTTTRHFDNRASWFSLDSTSASYQEALPSCTHPGQLTRTRLPFEPVRPRGRIENRQLARGDLTRCETRSSSSRESFGSYLGGVVAERGGLRSRYGTAAGAGRRDPDHSGGLGLAQERSNAPDFRWMVVAGQDGRTVPPVVMTRWQWYKAACARHRWRYMVTELLGLVSAAAVPAAVAMRLGSSVIAVLGAIVVITSGTRVLFGSHDACVEFSQIRYGIEREIALYLNACAPYDRDSGVQLLVARVEELAPSGVERWATRRVAAIPPVDSGGV
ncbi:DUF4231 domain-containing protein [Streptomyces sp. NPDC090083]|uniref:DUF4231 domain-containing protein n=1 Tax=Streptomyces sp. NPDC090083 TaxID=3365941 RepID=UPI00380F453D